MAKFDSLFDKDAMKASAQVRIKKQVKRDLTRAYDDVESQKEEAEARKETLYANIAKRGTFNVQEALSASAAIVLAERNMEAIKAEYKSLFDEDMPING